jgi:hypothetical protein
MISKNICDGMPIFFKVTTRWDSKRRVMQQEKFSSQGLKVYIELSEKTEVVPFPHLIAVLAAQLGTPRGRYDKHSGKCSLSMKPRFNRPVGERNHL